jgi:hypothetical protein
VLGSREESKAEETREGSTERVISGRELLQLMLNRAVFPGLREREEENKRGEEVIGSRRSRRRRYHYYDEQAESYDELINPIQEEEYIDFRTYPLLIDWKEVENDESEAYEIFEKFGYFGVSCFTTLSKHNHIKFSDKIFKNILEFYIKNFESNSPESLKNIENFIHDLPSLEQIQRIIFLRLISNKELIPIKLVLDLFEHYFIHFDNPLYRCLIKQYIPIATSFYQSLSDEDLSYMYEKLNGMTETSDLLNNKLKVTLTKNRNKYLKKLANLKTEMLRIIGGNTKGQFII